MANEPVSPRTAEIEKVGALGNAVIRNLRITDCYHRLSNALRPRTGHRANWCTFATWASRQAGRTIRGEDLLADLQMRLRLPVQATRPVESFWRRLLRNGLLQPDTRLGHFVAAMHSPFDAIERASGAVAEGNLRVFAEIGHEFARYLESCPAEAAADSAEFRAFLGGLRPGPPPEGQDLLGRAFTNYQQQAHEPDETRRIELVVLANLQIGLHEQTRLQPQIIDALNAGATTAEDLGDRALRAVFPGSGSWWRGLQAPARAAMGAIAGSAERSAQALARQVITDHLMVLAVPGQVLRLGHNLATPVPPSLVRPASGELAALILPYEPLPPAPDDCGARDWGQLDQRMHYISHLFRALHDAAALFDAPFTLAQRQQFEAGKVPGGVL
jgi:hypothetical protein